MFDGTHIADNGRSEVDADTDIEFLVDLFLELLRECLSTFDDIKSSLSCQVDRILDRQRSTLAVFLQFLLRKDTIRRKGEGYVYNDQFEYVPPRSYESM